MNDKELFLDITGIKLQPSKNGEDCLGNGTKGFECCCDECDYFQYCFEEYNYSFFKSKFENDEKRILKLKTFLKSIVK